jgi:hypothetical protein
MSNRSGESEHPCLLPDFRGNGFSFWPITYDVGYRFVIYSLSNVSVHPSIPSFRRTCTMKWC